MSTRQPALRNATNLEQIYDIANAVENAYTSGLLLPQVPIEYGWGVEEFLCHTCEKAGLEKMHGKTRQPKYRDLKARYSKKKPQMEK